MTLQDFHTGLAFTLLAVAVIGGGVVLWRRHRS